METSVFIEDFSPGSFVRGAGYQYFMPERINREFLWRDSGINVLLERASIKLGELNSFARLVPNIDLFIHLYSTKEALISSRIEGTQTTLDEAFMTPSELDPERKDDWLEVQQYTRALNTAIGEMERLPLSSRLLRKAHEILLSSGRGEHKSPGSFRVSQNWIGGASLSDAVFVPPPQHLVGELMGDLENFLHNDQLDVPRIIRIAIAHYQFETIHPFLDGNGRLGRLMITLYLMGEGILDKPLLYLSAFFESNKVLYYDNLTRVRVAGDLLQWVKYFLVGVEKVASDSARTLLAVLEMKARFDQAIEREMGRKAVTGLKLLQGLFRNPVVRIQNVADMCEISFPSASELVKLFVRLGILEEITGNKRNRIFLFKDYLRLFE